MQRFKNCPFDVRLWPCCAREIACAAGLSVLAVTDLSLPVANAVLASDASSVGYGVTASTWGDDIWRLWVTPLVPPVAMTESLGIDDVFESDDVPLLWEDVEYHDWLTIEAGPCGAAQNHIHVDEMNAAIRAVVSACSGTRQILLTDSAVVFGAVN